MPTFGAPLINLYSRDLPRAVAFYSELGFVETFRTPASGEPSHVQLKLGSISELRQSMQQGSTTAFVRKEKGAGSKSSFGPMTLMLH
jgi:catechol 2,3-dioxygenase-like lactoylglutathione lyase family enzyme